MLIPPFTLPSDPTKEIVLREATVEDALDFSALDPSREEAATTAFLNRIQNKDFFLDSRDWTADDRRFALLWYFVCTEDDHRYSVTYQCQCGKEHRHTFDLKTLLDSYHAIKGAAFRKAEFDGKKLVVKPISGRSIETLELERIAFGLLPAGSAEARQQGIKMKLQTLLSQISFEDGVAPAPGEDSPVELWIQKMGVKSLEKLIAIVGAMVEEMEHGLESVYEDGRVYFVSPKLACPDDKEVTTRVRVTFRNSEFIPQL